MNYTDEEIEKQFDSLPDEVQDNLFSPAIKQKVSSAGVAIGLTNSQVDTLNALVNYVLLELLQKNDFVAKCQEIFSIDSITASELSQIISSEIFTPMEEIKMMAIKKHLEEAADEAGTFVSEPVSALSDPIFTPHEILPSQQILKTASGSAPENLPTSEKEEPLFPPIPPKTKTESTGIASHPFEEKMSVAFTKGESSLGNIAITPSAEKFPPNQTPPPQFRTDPYREPIE